VSVIVYRWRDADFVLTYDPETGRTVTTYDDLRWSGCDPVPEDALHAGRLGITPGEHRLAHELAHHIVGFAGGYVGSRVIRWDAHEIPQDWHAGGYESEIEEWHTTAVVYAALGALDRADEEGNYSGAVEHLNKNGMRFPRLSTGLYLAMPWEFNKPYRASLARTFGLTITEDA
jgi:hypothetical protein